MTEPLYISFDQALTLLDSLIATPSPTGEEQAAADIVEQFLLARGLNAQRFRNNVWAISSSYSPERPTLMLNAHIDTVKPSPAYTRPPYKPEHIDGRIYGLGSNDDAGSIVSLIATFCNNQHKPLPFNLLLTITAEEERSGPNGIAALLPHLANQGIKPDMALVGEPTGMQPAIAERGLIVLDCIAHGKSGHAARNEGINALYIALDDIHKLRSYEFPTTSPTLGPVKISVTQIEAGTQHNVVPAECRFVVDVRTTDAYTNEQVESILNKLTKSELKARSHRIRASVIAVSHPMVQAAIRIGGKPFVSPTTSDMALMPNIPTLKMGPGDSARSHSADEYILESEILRAIDLYQAWLLNLAQIIK